uniref:Uncharacterized protein n=1 Tax=Steinernema glaseri TaxID=37863 RepID=A0A1I8AEY0_9BILA
MARQDSRNDDRLTPKCMHRRDSAITGQGPPERGCLAPLWNCLSLTDDDVDHAVTLQIEERGNIKDDEVGIDD